MYYVGQGVKRDLSEAIKWLESASKKGRGEAAHNLGTLYLTCEPEISRNEEISNKWYQKAKRLGFKVAPDQWYGERNK